MSQAQFRPRRPPPLAASILTGESEARLLQRVPHRSLLEEHRTAAPWCITNQRLYLEAPHVANGDESGATPLHLAAEQNLSRLAGNILAGGARVDLPDNKCRTPLMAAAESGNPDVVSVLLEARAASDALDASGRSPLHYAMTFAEGTAEAVRMLASARADLGARDCDGVTPLMVGAKCDAATAVEALLRLRASPFAFDRQGRTPLDFARGSRRRPESPGATFAVPSSPLRATKCYPRYDHLGTSKVEQLLLHEDRTLRRRTVPELSLVEMACLRSGMPQLC